jgi:sensor histidine kinase YesM
MKKQTVYKLISHILFWLVFCYLTIKYLQNWLPSVKIYASFAQLLNYSLVYIVLLAAAPYFNYFVLVPRYFSKKKYWWYAILLLCANIITSLLICWVEALFLHAYNPEWLFTMPHLVSRIPYLLLFTLLGNWLALTEELNKKQQAEKQLKAERTEAELRWLKAQVNPHFLFNALNNIHSLVHFKEDNAAPMLVKLSNMMRYMFYDSSAAKVSLLNEAAYIDSYIELHLLKKKFVNKVQFTKDIAGTGIMIEPMLFINFIENAFKHGNLDDDRGFITIHLAATDKKIIFACNNSFNSNAVKDNTPGIGLDNVKKRLALLYPGQYQLQINNSNNCYTVELIITLSK